ncbi:MAG: DUF4376 domain-containing protein [Helicobacter sp.]|nr:DUF4376 domain-containing protein [Helicobacter sp.]
MRYFKNNNNEIFGFEDDFLEIPSDLTPLSEEEVNIILSPSPEEMLEIAKYEKRLEIEQKRDEAINVDIEFNEEIFSNKKADRDAISSFLSSNLPKDFAWIAKNNTLVPMSKKALTELASLMFAKVNENTIKARRLKDRVEEISTLEELEAITWE